VSGGHAHGHHDDHDHDHGHGHDGHTHGGVPAAIMESRDALRTLWISLAVLAVTALAQVVVVVLSGSVALLADTVHNAGDALTAVPLGAAFILSRRPATSRLTYGWGRSEDLAGLAVLGVILFSAGYAAWESVARLIDPSTPGMLPAVVAAGLVGFAGNEWVAVYRIRTGRRIGSAALVADGRHARIDGITSLAVVAGAIGVALGFPLADPLVGMAIAVVILHIVWTSAREILLRMLDGIEPETVEELRHQAGHVPGVLAVEEVRARWVGHEIRAEVNVVVPPELTVAEGHDVAVAVRRRLIGRIDHLSEAIVHVDPASAAGEHRHDEARAAALP
jgi:cation diffusion facilitator family transporter